LLPLEIAVQWLCSVLKCLTGVERLFFSAFNAEPIGIRRVSKGDNFSQ
jgi:hypothetical protein